MLDLNNLFPTDVKKIAEQINQPLHKDLKPYLEFNKNLKFDQIRHPLLYLVPHLNNGIANLMYVEKTIQVKKALEEHNYDRYVFLHERPYRIDAFIKIQNLLQDVTYWELLSAVWIDTENMWQHLDDWKILLTSLRPHKEMLMTEEERQFKDNLKNRVQIYRGCELGVNEIGLSWTLSKEKAEWFANRFGKNGIVRERPINKPEIIAYINARGEQEIIVKPFIKNRKKY